MHEQVVPKKTSAVVNKWKKLINCNSDRQILERQASYALINEDNNIFKK